MLKMSYDIGYVLFNLGLSLAICLIWLKDYKSKDDSPVFVIKFIDIVAYRSFISMAFVFILYIEWHDKYNIKIHICV